MLVDRVSCVLIYDLGNVLFELGLDTYEFYIGLIGTHIPM